MAIDHTGLNGIPLFPYESNWATNPSIKLTPRKQIVGFPGTSQDLTSLSQSIRMDLQIELLFNTKIIEKTFFDFFDARKGRLERFWIKKPLVNYSLYATCLTTAPTIDINSSDLDLTYRGHERIFIDHLNGNSCIKHITDLAVNTSPDYLTLTLDAVVTDTWIVGDPQIRMGQVKLVRFDQDDLVVDYTTDRVSKVTLKMVELIYEYAEI